jgi:23S rRNA (uracil1939-C5)-methyltransferase
MVVWEGIPGEAAQVQVQHDGEHRVRASFRAPAEGPHPLRRAAACPRYTACGSCPLMHLEPEGQARARLALARQAFAAEGLGELAPTEFIPSPDGEEGYRHVVKLAVGASDRGNIRVGAYRRGSHDVVPIPECLVATPTLRLAMRSVAHHVRELDLHPYDPATGRGTLRHVVLRQSRASGQVLCTLVAARSTRLLGELATRVMSIDTGIVGVHLHLNDDPGNAIFQAAGDPEGPGFSRLEGAPTILDELAGLRLEIGPGDFFQANPAMAGRLALDLVERLSPWHDRPALDLYCGVGGFSLALARAHGFALGVEAVPGAVRRAAVNAQLNKLAAEFLAGSVGDLLPALQARLGDRAPVVLVDPARRGLEPDVIEGILSLQPSAVAYISCAPRSMARDLAQFQAAGWTFDRPRAYDMFPQTAHVELFTVLQPPVAPVPTGRAPQRRIPGRA